MHTRPLPGLHLDCHAPRRHEGRLRLEATLSGHAAWRLRRRNGLVFFEIPAELGELCAIQGRADDLHDAFLRGIIFSAMESPGPLHIHGRISESLLRGIHEYQAVIHSWWPRYRPVEVRADEVAGDDTPGPVKFPGHGVLAYSGGLDSTFSLHRHHHGLAAGEAVRLAACVFAHGFDVAVENLASFGGAFDRIRRITDDLGLPLIPVRTNLKEMLPWWPHSHGAAIAGALSLLGRGYDRGLIAASYGAERVVADVPSFGWGSSRWSDPLLSSSGFRIVHDEAVNRVEKSHILTGWAAARGHVRVCFRSIDASRNCGRCDKCLMQIVHMRMAGILDLEAFEHAPTIEEIAGDPRLVAVAAGARLINWERNLRLARSQGVLPASEIAGLETLLEQLKSRRYQLRWMIKQGYESIAARVY